MFLVCMLRRVPNVTLRATQAVKHSTLLRVPNTLLAWWLKLLPRSFLVPRSPFCDGFVIYTSPLITPQYLYAQPCGNVTHLKRCLPRRLTPQGSSANDTMFIKKDTRKIPDILSDESDEREELHLGRRCARDLLKGWMPYCCEHF